MFLEIAVKAFTITSSDHLNFKVKQIVEDVAWGLTLPVPGRGSPASDCLCRLAGWLDCCPLPRHSGMTPSAFQDRGPSVPFLLHILMLLPVEHTAHQEEPWPRGHRHFVSSVDASEGVVCVTPLVACCWVTHGAQDLPASSVLS